MRGFGTGSIEQQQAELAKLKAERKDIPKHILLKDLPTEQRFDRLISGRKHFIDTIKLIAYRSETALVLLAREVMSRHDDARSFIRGLMQTTANLKPDLVAKELRIELHSQANPSHQEIVRKICAELNDTETYYPGTELRLKYVTLGSSHFPPDQEV